MRNVGGSNHQDHIGHCTFSIVIESNFLSFEQDK